MNIILTIKAVLNYLYNHLIDLINVKKIVFEDGSEQITASKSGASLFDIKLLSQAIADKGWAFMCHTTRRDLPKTDVPTLYNDIFYKYNNANKEFVMTESNTAYAVQYDSYSNKFIYRPKSQNKLYSSDLVDLSNPTDLNISDVYEFMLGQNINIVKGYANSYGGNYYIYSKDWELIRTINLSGEYNNISTYRYVNGAFLFLVNDNDNFHKVCYLMKFEDNINVENPIISNNFKLLDSNYRGMNISDIIDNKIYITCAGGSNSWDSWFLEINFNDLSYINIYKSNIPNNTYNNYANITKYEDKYYFGSITGVYQSSDLVNWTLVYSLATACYYIEKIDNIFYIICNGFIITTENFLTFNVIISFTGSGNNFVNCYVGNDTYIFNFKNNPSYLYGGSVLKIYTDTYTINGTSININYYKYDDFKICISDGGTNDTNLETLYNYLGYLNYWLIDIINETVCVQRDKNTYSVMFVGDDFIDNLEDLPTNDYANVVLKNQLPTIVSSLISADTINNLQDGTKDTVYQTSKPTLIVAGRTSNASDWYLEIQLSANGTNFITVARYGVSNGDPSSSAIIPIVIGSGVYWKVVTSLTTGYIKYGAIE